MSLEADFVAVLQACCPRVFPGSAPANQPQPYVTWEQLGGDAARYVDNTPMPKRLALLQVDTWAATKAEAMQLAREIEDALCAATSINARPVAGQTGRQEEYVDAYGVTQDFEVLGAR